MKYLSSYTQDAQTKLLNDTGAFFAFSMKQAAPHLVDGVKYVNIGAGLFTPVKNAKTLIDGLENIHAEGIKQDIAENGLKAIIHRELGNYEAQITCDLSDTVDALEAYGITEADIKKEWPSYYQMCIDNDYF